MIGPDPVTCSPEMAATVPVMTWEPVRGTWDSGQESRFSHAVFCA